VGNLYGNNKPKQAIQKAGPENKAYKEGPPGSDCDIQQICFFPGGKKRFCSKCAKLVILVYMFGDRMVGVVENVTFQVINPDIFLQNNFVVWICSSPMRNPAIEKADFCIRIPASMSDKLATITAATIHPISPICKIFFDSKDTLLK
jgi:hypothetical protein